MIENKVYHKYEKGTGDIPVEGWEEILKKESVELNGHLDDLKKLYSDWGQDRIGDKKFYAGVDGLITVIKADVRATLESSGLILKQLKESGKIDYVPVKD